MAGAFLMIVAWHEFLRNALIFYRRLQHHAAAELIDHGALDFLPRRLARRIVIAAVLVERRAARRQFRGRDEDIGAALVEIDAHTVASLQERQPAAGRRFGR